MHNMLAQSNLDQCETSRKKNQQSRKWPTIHNSTLLYTAWELMTLKEQIFFIGKKEDAEDVFHDIFLITKSQQITI